MRVAVIGAGPAGLLFSLLAKRRYPSWRIEVAEHNPEGATYGFGVVFSDGALAFLERDEPQLSNIMQAAMERWPMQRIVHRDERVDIDGNGFSAIGRLALQEILRKLCGDAGVEIGYGRAVTALEELDGADVVVGADGSKSLWRQFPLLSNRCWSSGKFVLIGDALRTVHFSIGSGTRLAFEDAIALDRAFGEAGEDVPRALAAFERERRPVVEKLLAAANASSYWYERFPEKMREPPWRLAYDYMTRSGRMTDDRLREQAPKFMRRVEAERAGGS